MHQPRKRCDSCVQVWNGRRLHRVLAVLALLFSAATSRGSAASPRISLWVEVDEASVLTQPSGDRFITPLAYRVFLLDQDALESTLAEAPMELTASAADDPAVIELPMPDGRLSRFVFSESPVMAPELGAKYPELRTYKGYNVDNPVEVVRFDRTPLGFHAMILSPSGTVFIDPLRGGNTTVYQTYYKRDFRNETKRLSCLGEERLQPEDAEEEATATSPDTAVTFRQYRLAMAATGEYSVAICNLNGVPVTVPNALAGVMTTVNRINQVYERDVAVRMVLVANNDQIIYLSSAGDPYSTDPVTRLGQNQSNLDIVIGTANYDIGHVVSTGFGGVAGVAIVCSNGQKARGTTALNQPTGDPFDIDFVAHEIGHQYGGNHTFNGTTGLCAGSNRNAATAYEVGSGSTVMGLAGQCTSQDLQPNSDDYFHLASINEITTRNAGAGNCSSNTVTANLAPEVSAGPAFTIPSRTPFAETAVGTDANGDTLTYCWEEFDLGAANSGSTDNGASPILRSFDPTTSPTRGFPKLSDVLAGTTTYGELLPTTSRTMNFRVTARDNNVLGGGTANATTTVTSVAAAGPFQITSQNVATSWTGLTQQVVTWNVAGTTGNGINTAEVHITFSSDGGVTFPFVLDANVPNDGSESITVPNVSTSAGRIKVEAIGNIFFDINNGPITVSLAPSADLAITKTDGVTTATPGGSVTYTISAGNSGPSGAAGATVNDAFPAVLSCNWTCSGTGGATCAAAGSGDIGETVTLPSGGQVNFIATCAISAAAFNTLSNTASVTVPAGMTDPSLGNNSATDVDLFSTIFNDGFENGTTSRWSTTVPAGGLRTGAER